MNLSEQSFRRLGLAPGAGQAEIKQAFKELAFQHHPDRNPHQSSSEETFKEIAQAYAYLMGNQEAYQALSASPKTTKASSQQDFEDIYQMLFEVEHLSQAKRAPDLLVKVTLTLEEAFRGGSTRLAFERQDLCRDCQGEGVALGAKTWTCTYCFGEGQVGDKKQSCPRCAGRGFLSSQPCLTCRGRGFQSKAASLKVKYPALWNPQKILKIPDQGHEYQAGSRAPLQVRLFLKEHKSFSFDGANVLCEVEVPMELAALGGEVQVPTLKGNKKVKLPPGTQSGSSFCLKNYGLGGDQFVRWQVKTLRAVQARQRHLLSQLSPATAQGLWQKIKRYLW